MRGKGQAVVDWIVLLLLGATWLYASRLTDNGIVFGALGVVLVALLFRLLRPARAAQAQTQAEPRLAGRLGRRAALLCMGFVLATVAITGPQVLVARAVKLRTEYSVNDRGQKVVGNHIRLGKHDLAWVRAELESEGAIASECGLFSAAQASIHPMHVATLGMSEDSFLFDWELRFGWPFAVRKWKETQFVGPEGVQRSVVSTIE